MFAVYDGHGKHGHSCAQFARDRLPKAIAKHVRKLRVQKYQKSRAADGKKGAWDPDKWPLLSRSEYESCCQRAFLEVNQAMNDAPNVIDALSGTTAVTVNFHGEFAAICNVGDSRVIIGHRVRGSGKDISIYFPDKQTDATLSYDGEEEKNEIDDEIELETTPSAVACPVIKPGSSFSTRRSAPPGTSVVAIPLTKDQTPYRKDERDRVKAMGATIMSIDQMQGKEEMHEDWGDLILGETIDYEGDSPRVWANGKDYPGCAFTRSLGDSMSKSIGVTAVPEILCTELTQNDEYLVVASDGIFEFLTNQTIIDLCAASESPLVACEKIVKASYDQWLTYENRTDDITIVVCFLQNFKPPTIGSIEGTTEDLVAGMSSIYGKASKRMPPPPESALAWTKAESSGKHSLPKEVTFQTEQQAIAYVSQEAQAAIVKDHVPPRPTAAAAKATTDEKFVSLLDERCRPDSDKTASITSVDADDTSVPETDKIGTNPIDVASCRNAIQI
jgi:serine/threonine protein phosphatase PrpC